jgi:hypothetical protein
MEVMMVLVAVRGEIQKIYLPLDGAARKARWVPAVRWRLVSVLHYSCERGHILVVLLVIAAAQEHITAEGEGQVFEEVMSPPKLMLVGEALQVVLASAMALGEAVWVPWMMVWAARVMGARRVWEVLEALVSAPLVSKATAWVQLVTELAVSEALVEVLDVYWKALLRILFLESHEDQ